MEYLPCPTPQDHFFCVRIGVISWSPILDIVYPVAWPEQHRAGSESCWLRQPFGTCTLSKVTDSCWKQRVQQEIGLPSPFWQVEERREAAGRMGKNPVLWASFIAEISSRETPATECGFQKPTPENWRHLLESGHIRPVCACSVCL